MNEKKFTEEEKKIMDSKGTFSDVLNDFKNRLEPEIPELNNQKVENGNSMPQKVETTDNSLPLVVNSSSAENIPIKSSRTESFEKNHEPAIVDSSDKYAGRENIFNKTQILLIILIAVIVMGIFIFYNQSTSGNLHSVLNSTCVNNVTIPECPVAPACSLNCPAQNITLSIPNNLTINYLNISGNHS